MSGQLESVQYLLLNSSEDFLSTKEKSKLRNILILACQSKLDISLPSFTIAKVEAEHEKRFLKLLQNVSEDRVFMKDGKVWWQCMVCGYTYESEKALENCPACLHPQKYMKMKAENY